MSQGLRPRVAALVPWQWRDRARHAAATVLRPFLRAEIAAVTRCDLTRPLPEVSCGVALEARIARPEEVLGEVARLQPDGPAREGLVQWRLAHGFACFVGRVDGRLVAYNWSQYEPGEDGGMYVDLRPGEVHCLDAYTAEDLRGRNIHAALLREMLRHNAAQGYRYAYSRTSLTNRRSPKAHEQLGWERRGRALMATWRGGPVLRLSGSIHPWRRLRLRRR